MVSRDKHVVRTLGADEAENTRRIAPTQYQVHSTKVDAVIRVTNDGTKYTCSIDVQARSRVPRQGAMMDVCLALLCPLRLLRHALITSIIQRYYRYVQVQVPHDGQRY